MFVVDTNVLIYAADKHAQEHKRCRELLEIWRRGNGAWYLTWGICFEFLRIVTHARVFRKPWSATDAWSFLESLQVSPGLAMLVPGDQHRHVVAEILKEVPLIRGNLFHDVETAALMREHGIHRICTRDTDFHRFGFLRSIDPMTETP